MLTFTVKGISFTKRILFILSFCFWVLVICCFKNLFAQTQGASTFADEQINLQNVVILTPENLSSPELKAVEMLIQEVEKRTHIRWKETHSLTDRIEPVIIIGQQESLKRSVKRFPQELILDPVSAAEGYAIFVETDGDTAHAIYIIGADARGVLFGIGRFLRELRMSQEKITIPKGFNVKTAPKYPLRGHQLGYRPKTNSYDGWSVAIWEQYIRDLAVFGTNAIELIPPRSDDDPDSPHFPISQIDMMVAMSDIINQYGLDVWIWYPAMDKDYADPETVEFALKEWGEIFKKLPRVDAVFVPGGDPGHTQPKYLMALLEKETEVLHRYHPKAQMWISPQSFNKEWLDEFFGILKTQEPKWLSGVVYGPQVRGSISELRQAIPSQYPIRHYPDITHSIRCEYPVQDWDLAFALTEAREVINPRPQAETAIFHATQDGTIGFLTYSEGCNDDVNKIIWSALGWDPQTKVIDILHEYSRYFIDARFTDEFAQGLLSLEKNWKGPLLTNESVYTTLQQFQNMEKTASPPLLLNWRFQQALYRAYYDAYLRSRLLYETELENKAMNILRSAQQLGSLSALDHAEEILNQANFQKSSPDWRARVFELAEALYQSIRMQLSVERYQAIEVGRGANLDLIDVPINNRIWLQQRFGEVRLAAMERERLEGIEKILNWTNPGPGGFYDDLGNLSYQPHLIRNQSYEKDPAFLKSPLIGFAFRHGWRLSWGNHADAMYEAPLTMHYSDLDRNAEYKVRVVYAGDSFETRVRLTADENAEVHPYMKKVTPLQPLEFDIPYGATSDGELTLTWFQEKGRGGNGRGCQVAEVWVVKK